MEASGKAAVCAERCTDETGSLTAVVAFYSITPFLALQISCLGGFYIWRLKKRVKSLLITKNK
jgi:hypothetical protein